MPDKDVRRFGTFLGVYTPSVLTILGVMMYLRFGWVIGNIGLPLALFTVILASSITFITGLSASAISTNMRVGVGGEYFMISRSLGMEIGGAIGIPLFLCRTLSLTLYAFGLSESIAFLYPHQWGAAPITWMTVCIIILIISVAGKSADISLKLQFPIIGAVGLSLNTEWRNADIYMRTIINSEKNRETMRERLESFISDLRIKAEPDLIVNDEELGFAEIMSRESKNTDVTFLGLKLPEEDGLDEYADSLFEMARGNSSFIFVRNASPYRGKLIS